jgi:putative flippase GtrA
MVEAAEARTPLSLADLRPRLLRLFHETWKYLLVSLVALGVDFGLLVALKELARLPVLVAAPIGFSAGVVVNYVLTVTLVYSDRRMENRHIEFIGFVAIGVVGLGLNQVLMSAFMSLLGAGFLFLMIPGYAWAKIGATGVGFVFNFVTRRLLLFSAVR